MDREVEKQIRADTISALVAMSAAYSRTPSHSALKHWQRFEQRLRQSLSGATTIGQWQEKFRSALGIVSLSSSTCSALEALDRSLDANGVRFSTWLWLVRGETAWFMVQLRLESEAKKLARESKKEEA